MKDEALSPVGFLMESLPIAQPTDSIRKKIGTAVCRIVEITEAQQATRGEIVDWLRVQHEIDKPSMRLRAPVELDCDGFVAEVKKVRGKKRPLSAAALKNLREEHARSIEPARTLATEALKLEHEVSNLVNEAYDLTPEEVALLWQTAPPRMPIAEPQPAHASQ